MSTAVAASTQSSTEEIVPQTPLQEQLMGLLSFREQCEAELADIDQERDAKKAELTECEAVLRAAKLIGPKNPTAKKAPGSGGQDDRSLVLPRSWPTHGRAIGAVKKIIAMIERFGGEEFQVMMISKETGSSNQIIEQAIGVMNGEGRIRILGKRPQIGRKAPGGMHVLTFKEIKMVAA